MTIEGRGRFSPKRSPRQQNLIDRVTSRVPEIVSPKPKVHVVALAHERPSWFWPPLGLYGLPVVGPVILTAFHLALVFWQRRALILTETHLIITSAPFRRVHSGRIRDILELSTLGVALFDPRMHMSPILHLQAPGRVLKFEFDNRWAPEAVELNDRLTSDGQ